MSIIEQNLSQLFTIIQQIAFQKQPASFNFPFIISLTKQTQQETINTMDDSLGLTQNNLKLVSHINFNELIPKLNQIWSGEYFGRDLKVMFNRNYHAELRNFKQLSQKSKKQNFNELKKQVNWSNVKLQNGQVQTELQINGCDIETLKKGEVAPTIITNYIKLLHTSKVISTNYFVFPFGFFDQIINVGGNDIQKIRASVIQNHTKLREQIQGSLCKPQYLLVPILIDKGYRLITVAHLSVQKKRKLILCNTSEEKAENFVQALKIFLEIDMHVSNKKKKKQSLKSLSTISIMLPKQINPKDTGLYLMLYCQFLFAKKAIQLENLSTITQHQKIHLFPRSLALKSRVQIWNLFARLLEQQNPQMRVEICQQFFKRRLQFCQEAILQLNYDKIEEQQVRKYMAIKREGFHKLGLDYYLDNNLHYQNSIQS